MKITWMLASITLALSIIWTPTASAVPLGPAARVSVRELAKWLDRHFGGKQPPSTSPNPCSVEDENWLLCGPPDNKSVKNKMKRTMERRIEKCFPDNEEMRDIGQQVMATLDKGLKDVSQDEYSAFFAFIGAIEECSAKLSQSVPRTRLNQKLREELWLYPPPPTKAPPGDSLYPGSR